jgi:hypothetical protein
MAVANINEFISSFKTELSRPCNFEVEIIPPAKLAGAVGGGSIAKFRCEQAELPARAFVLIDQKTYGPIEHYPVQNTYNKSAMVFICGDDMKEKTFFDAWMEIISGKQHNGVKFDFEYKVNYCTDIKITQMSLDGKEAYTVYLVDAFPAEVYSMPLSWAQVNDYNRLNVVLAYRYFKVFPGGSSSGELSQEQQRQSLVETLSKKAKDNAALKPPVLPPPKPPTPNEKKENSPNNNTSPSNQPEISIPLVPTPAPSKPPEISIALVPTPAPSKPPEISDPLPIAPISPLKPPEISIPLVPTPAPSKPPEIADDSGFRPVAPPPEKPPEISDPLPIAPISPLKPPEISIPLVPTPPPEKPPEISDPLPVAPISPLKPPEISIPLVPTPAPSKPPEISIPLVPTPAPSKPPEIADDSGFRPVAPPPEKPPEVSDPLPVAPPPEKPPEIADDSGFRPVAPPPEKPPEIADDSGFRPVAPPEKPPEIADDSGFRPVAPPPEKPPEIADDSGFRPVAPPPEKPPEIKPPATQILTTNVTFTYNGVSKSKSVQSEIKTPTISYEIMDALKNNTKIPEIPPAPSKAVIQKENLMEVKYSVNYTNQEGQTKTVEFSDWIKTPPEVTQAFKDLETELKAQNPPYQYPKPVVLSPGSGIQNPLGLF